MYQLNRYSIAFIGVYFAAVFVMLYGSATNWSEGIIMTLPLIIMIVVWSELLTTRLSYKRSVSTADSFQRDFFIISYATLFAVMVSLLGEHNNTDAKGWWPLLIIIFELYGLVLGVVFASLALLLDRQHFRYTLIFAVVLAINFSTLQLMPPYVHTNILGDISTFFLCVVLLLGAHALLCIGYSFSKHKLSTK